MTDPNTLYRPATDQAGHQKIVPANGELDALVAAYKVKRVFKEMAADALTEAEKELSTAETALFDEMERMGLQSIRTPDGTFSLNDLPYARVADEDKARAWADDNLPELLTLNRQRLSTVVRQRLKAGEDLPPGVDFWSKRGITWRRA